ncbi:hypothetical protein [Clostridium perfringens]|uniref:hypothetical protein n=1 Tax=Clostridium perfringens TaxID=1502 RepID=UPI003F44481F
MNFSFEEKEFLRDTFKVLDREILINSIRKMEIDEEHFEELNLFKNNILNKLEKCSDKDLEKLFMEI